MRQALFKYLVIAQCNDLSYAAGHVPENSDYTELLFPDFLLREGSGDASDGDHHSGG